MRKTKLRMEPYSFFDHTGISAHLERMVQKGWMIDKIASYGWRYRRMEPKTVHFTVSYYPKASEFDSEPSEDQKMFQDFCAHTGWKLICTSAQMQIFYNEEEHPTPIETEPSLELEAIHASVKKSFLPSYFSLLAVSVLQVFMFVSSLRSDPVALLSSSSRLFTGFCFSLLALLFVVELVRYFVWYSRAKKAAEYGEFLKTPSASGFQKAVFAMFFIGFVYWAASSLLWGNTMERWLGIFTFIYVPALFLIVNTVKEFLKRRKASRSVNRTLTMLASAVSAFAMVVLVPFLLLGASSGTLFAGKDKEVYEYNGHTWPIYQDELPLAVEDLTDTDYKEYIKENRSDESTFLLRRSAMAQYPRFGADNYAEIPALSYNLVTVKAHFLYDICKESLIRSRERLYPDDERYYVPADAAPWGAEEAYRLYESLFGLQNDYLLCYNNLLVEIRFNWEPAEEQMRIVSEKLLAEET